MAIIRLNDYNKTITTERRALCVFEIEKGRERVWVFNPSNLKFSTLTKISDVFGNRQRFSFFHDLTKTHIFCRGNQIKTVKAFLYFHFRENRL